MLCCQLLEQFPFHAAPAKRAFFRRYRDRTTMHAAAAAAAVGTIKHYATPARGEPRGLGWRNNIITQPRKSVPIYVV
jgi:hypothetical protein